jgi:hypothetical protein
MSRPGAEDPLTSGSDLLGFCHGVALRQRRRSGLAIGIAIGFVLATLSARAEPGQTIPPDLRITPGQVIDGWTGLPIPCRCRYQGQTYRLGDTVCMNTHLGTVLTRCELFMNNTSWMPSREPCAISEARTKQIATLQPSVP